MEGETAYDDVERHHEGDQAPRPPTRQSCSAEQDVP